MAELMLLLAFLASAAAGIYDLKTTEVPEEIPALMVSFGLFYWFVSALTFGDFYPLAVSMSVGTLLLALGILAYKKGQWGGADAWILASIAYMVPLFGSEIFMANFLSNFLIVGALYTVIYAAGLGLLRPGVFSYFIKDIRINAKFFILPVFFLIVSLFTYAFQGIDAFLRLSIIFLLLVAFWRYGKIIESRVFRKRISSSALKEGDVVEGMIWRGITKPEINEIRKKKKYVVIKEGVRFVPAFPLTLLVTVAFGNLLFVFI
ncbi:MAG: prepilin peptidase [Candidatus Aenigmarchaeota archaeon]|nr:prepilin peptidase [Candidatus Aenigmarchaeota archaeon]